jgi:hypothetical protein
MNCRAIVITGGDPTGGGDTPQNTPLDETDR